LAILIYFAIVVFGFIVQNLDHIFSVTPAVFPFTDVTITILSVTAVILMVYKYIESWFIWIIANILTAIMCYYLGYYVLAGSNIFLIIMSWYGYKSWKKKLGVFIPFDNRLTGLKYINELDRANTEKELQENINPDDIKLAGERLGKKSQSAFETK
jgi:hypothetical protein